MRVVTEEEVDRRTVKDVEVYIMRLTWNDGGLSFDVYRAEDDLDLTEEESFDALPTDEEIARLIEHVGEHGDNDDCAKYLSDYYVKRDGEEVCITDLHPEDVFEELGQLWRVIEVCRVGHEIHVDLEKAD